MGIAEDLLIGELEAIIITRNLMRETKAVAWQMLPISVVSCGLPLLLALIFQICNKLDTWILFNMLSVRRCLHDDMVPEKAIQKKNFKHFESLDLDKLSSSMAFKYQKITMLYKVS